MQLLFPKFFLQNFYLSFSLLHLLPIFDQCAKANVVFLSHVLGATRDGILFWHMFPSTDLYYH